MTGERIKDERSQRKEKKRKEKNEREINLKKKKEEKDQNDVIWAIKKPNVVTRLKPREQASISSREYELGRKPLSAIAAFLNR